VHLICLRPALEGLIVPSKFYGILAAGRSSIFIGDPEGEVAQALARFHSGLTVALGDGQQLAQIVLELARNPARCRALGQNARRAFELEFDKRLAMERWLKLLRPSGPNSAPSVL
jgi:hypothetical protein